MQENGAGAEAGEEHNGTAFLPSERILQLRRKVCIQGPMILLHSPIFSFPTEAVPLPSEHSPHLPAHSEDSNSGSGQTSLMDDAMM